MMKRIFKWVLVLDVMLVNFAVGWLVYKSVNITPELRSSPLTLRGETAEVNTEYVDQCGQECRDYIDERISGITPVPTQKAGESKTVYVVPTVKKTRAVSYLTITGSGSTLSNEWFNFGNTEFYFDTRDYPGLVEIYFESNMKLFNGNGLAYVRLYDTTHGVGVQGSEVSTSSQADVLITSGKLNFLSGKNKIAVQGKSLTADTTVFNSGRLRIVTEN